MGWYAHAYGYASIHESRERDEAIVHTATMKYILNMMRYLNAKGMDGLICKVFILTCLFVMMMSLQSFTRLFVLYLPPSSGISSKFSNSRRKLT